MNAYLTSIALAVKPFSVEQRTLLIDALGVYKQVLLTHNQVEHTALIHGTVLAMATSRPLNITMVNLLRHVVPDMLMVAWNGIDGDRLALVQAIARRLGLSDADPRPTTQAALVRDATFIEEPTTRWGKAMQDPAVRHMLATLLALFALGCVARVSPKGALLIVLVVLAAATKGRREARD